MNREDVLLVWRQQRIPVVDATSIRGGELRVRLPARVGNYAWLRGGRQRKPWWDAVTKSWHCPRAWLDAVVRQCADRFERVYLLQVVSETEKCAPACLNARGLDCVCSCEGVNHGHGNDGRWFEISETFALRSGERFISCRLIARRATTGF